MCALFPHRYSLRTLGFSMSGLASQVLIANQWSILFFTSSNLLIIFDPTRYIKDFEYAMPENERKAIADGVIPSNTDTQENPQIRQGRTNMDTTIITDAAARIDAAETLLSMNRKSGGKTRSNKRTNRRKTSRK